MSVDTQGIRGPDRGQPSPGSLTNNFKELMKERFTKLNFQAFKGDADSKLFNYLFIRENAFLVMGAYGRSTLSMFFKRSHADMLIKTKLQPIFITHL